jgi:hypothetical protein
MKKLKAVSGVSVVALSAGSAASFAGEPVPQPAASGKRRKIRDVRMAGPSHETTGVAPAVVAAAREACLMARGRVKSARLRDRPRSRAQRIPRASCGTVALETCGLARAPACVAEVFMSCAHAHGACTGEPMVPVTINATCRTSSKVFP